MTKKLNLGELPTTRQKYTPAFKAECVRQAAAGARQSDEARAQGISPALLGRWQRQPLEQSVPSSATRAEIKQLRAELRHVEMERDILKKVVTIFLFPAASVMSRYQFIQDCTEPWSVQALCHVLGVSCAGYYQWRGRAQPHQPRSAWRGALCATLVAAPARAASPEPAPAPAPAPHDRHQFEHDFKVNLS